ncbi:exosortase H-associated membrane protein [Sphingomonas sp. NCPPB 2930]
MNATAPAVASPPRPAPSLRRFFLLGLAWLVVLTAGWLAVSPWTSYPSAVLARIGLEAGAPYWIRKVQLHPARIDVETRLEVVTQGPAGKMRGEIDVSAKPAHYAYGLPVFLALLLAARSRSLVRRALLGYLVLLPFQAFSLAFDLLKQMAMAAAGTPGALGVSQWQLEGIAYGYQFGVLVLPTLAPVVVWLVLDREFFQSVAAPWRPAAAARA